MVSSFIFSGKSKEKDLIKNGYCLVHINSNNKPVLNNYNLNFKKILRIFYIVSFAIGLLMMGYLSCNRTQPETFQYKLLYSFLSGALHSDVCNIPQLDPWDQTILKYLTKFKPLQCKKLQPELTYLDFNGMLTINESARIESGYSSINCQYRCFNKIEGLDDVTLRYEKWIVLESNETKIDCEFIEVTCSGSIAAISIYSNSHNQIIVNRTKLNIIKEDHVTDKPSILLFILDSISKSNFYRSLPKFLNVLKYEYDSVIMEGFTKVGDNSFPNAAAALTGKRVLVAGYESELPDDMSQSFFDDWPLIWNNFRNSGYVTYYAEDYPNFNLFQYTSNGFKVKPTDHYFRPYWVQLWGSFLHRRSTHLCYANSPKHLLQLNYLEQFLNKYGPNVPKFSFNWLTELGHDWLGQIALGDDNFADFFRKMKPSLNNTILVVFSDHGHRFDTIRESVIGRIEERMPFCAISLPRWMKSKYPLMYSNLKTNSKMLTTPFDLHATLTDILRNNFTDVNKALRLSTRGMSLFRPIAKSRNCFSAGVPEEFCVCQEETPVNTSDEKVIVAANKLVDHVNSLLFNVSSLCAKLYLTSVRNAQTFLPNSNTVFDDKSSTFYGANTATGFYINYRINIETSPSGAFFEAMLRYSFVDNNFSVIGDVNRINKYGNQSLCVSSALLKKFCYCLSR